MKCIILVVFAACVALATGASHFPKPQRNVQGRIVGGSTTSINQYPFAAAMLSSGWGFWAQWCGGSVLTGRTVLSAAHCFEDNLIWDSPSTWLVRLGSTNSNSGGWVYQINLIVAHQNYNNFDMDHDLVVVRTTTNIMFFNNLVAQVPIAGSNYNLADNQQVWAIGWGQTELGSASIQLRHVQLWSINQQVCQQRYGRWLTQNMLCAGWLNIATFHQCFGDSGGPLLHNGVQVGICSFGMGCDSAYYPSVNVRVSSFSSWITNTVMQIS